MKASTFGFDPSPTMKKKLGVNFQRLAQAVNVESPGKCNIVMVFKED